MIKKLKIPPLIVFVIISFFVLLPSTSNAELPDPYFSGTWSPVWVGGFTGIQIGGGRHNWTNTNQLDEKTDYVGNDAYFRWSQEKLFGWNFDIVYMKNWTNSAFDEGQAVIIDECAENEIFGSCCAKADSYSVTFLENILFSLGYKGAGVKPGNEN
jgi:hypothetical protein